MELEWYWMLIFISGVLLILMGTGMPIAFAFVITNIILAFFLQGGSVGIEQVILSMRSVAKFTLIPIPLFLLMGELIFRSGIAPKMMDALDVWIGRLPGRLSLMAVAGGTLFSTMTGSPAASVAMLGSTLVPEMTKRGYSKEMSLGPIMGSGSLAMMIPPSGMAVLAGALGEINIGDILIAIIIPGLLMAVLIAGYIIIRCSLKPSIAPIYDVPPVPLSTKLSLTARYILPVALVIFFVVGVIFLGIATPTEAAATGALGTFILAAAYGKLNGPMLKKVMIGTLRSTGMVMFIIAGAEAFANILAYTGGSGGLSKFVAGLDAAPILIIIAFLLASIVLGTFMGPAPIMMITLPIFVPIVKLLGFDPVWFAVIFLITIEMSELSPPYGMALFVMKGVAPKGTTMGDCYSAAMPYCYLNCFAIALIMAVPSIALFLPALMRNFK